MEEIILESLKELPENYTGIVSLSTSFNQFKYWYVNGRLHRENGPAIEYADGHKEWYLNGECHRVDGPAVEYANGDKYWYYYDTELNKDKIQELLDLDYPPEVAIKIVLGTHCEK